MRLALPLGLSTKVLSFMRAQRLFHFIIIFSFVFISLTRTPPFISRALRSTPLHSPLAIAQTYLLLTSLHIRFTLCGSSSNVLFEQSLNYLA